MGTAEGTTARATATSVISVTADKTALSGEGLIAAATAAVALSLLDVAAAIREQAGKKP